VLFNAVGRADTECLGAKPSDGIPQQSSFLKKGSARVAFHEVLHHLRICVLRLGHMLDLLARMLTEHGGLLVSWTDSVFWRVAHGHDEGVSEWFPLNSLEFVRSLHSRSLGDHKERLPHDSEWVKGLSPF
jgi:hypothetical protein